MPNTVVKLINAESTWLEAAWEDRKLLIKKERDTQKCVSFFVVCERRGRKDGREGDSRMGTERQLQEPASVYAGLVADSLIDLKAAK